MPEFLQAGQQLVVRLEKAVDSLAEVNSGRGGLLFQVRGPVSQCLVELFDLSYHPISSPKAWACKVSATNF